MTDLPRISAPGFPDIRLRHPPNWTIVGFFTLLGGVHFVIAVRAMFAGRWESYLSLLLGTLFLLGVVVALLHRSEIGIQVSRRQIILRRGVARWTTHRVIPFAEVVAVRLTRDGEWHIEIVCTAEEIRIPATRVPRQEALFLAMMLDVKLIKVGTESKDRQTVVRS